MLSLTRPQPPAVVRDPHDTADDLSGHEHRQLIGYIGASLPLLVWLIHALRPQPGMPRWTPLGSISAYYYTGAVAVFVGTLIALAVFLLAYRGYRNAYQRVDRLVAIVAGCAAIGVAAFPAGAPHPLTEPVWWSPLTAWIHYGSAGLLFSAFAAYALWLFRLTDPDRETTPGKELRNRIYFVCGVIIVLCIAWVGVNGLTGRPIFWPETIALLAFAVSWLTKGRAVRSIRRLAR